MPLQYQVDCKCNCGSGKQKKEKLLHTLITYQDVQPAARTPPGPRRQPTPHEAPGSSWSRSNFPATLARELSSRRPSTDHNESEAKCPGSKRTGRESRILSRKTRKTAKPP